MISQKKLAEKLRMPVSTVANILHGTLRYKQQTRARVLKAAEEWGYRPNRACTIIQKKRSNLIAIVYFDASSKTAGNAVADVRREVAKLGYHYLVINVDWHDRDAGKLLEEMLQMRAEGVILVGNSENTFNAKSLAVLKKANIPVVSLWGDADLNVPCLVESILKAGKNEIKKQGMASKVERVARKAMQLSGRHMSEYGSYKSRHDFTQRQLMACLILRTYLKMTYRGLVDFLSGHTGLRGALGMEEKLPHYTTLQKFSMRSEILKTADLLIGKIGEAGLRMQGMKRRQPWTWTPPEWRRRWPAPIMPRGAGGSGASG